MQQGSQRFVLTGGIGSGKSYVAARLAARGWVIVEADQIGHDVLEPDGTAFPAVSARWPEVVRDGRIDRRALGQMVFASEMELAELESLTHPAIRAAIANRMVGHAKVALEIPLLNDWVASWPKVVVDAAEELRRTRLARRGLTDDEIDARLRAQPARSDWLAAADFVIDNNTGSDIEAEIGRLEVWLKTLPDGLRSASR